MSAECPCARPRKRTFASWVTTCSLGIAATLVPKCPLCVAAYLSMVGVGTATAGMIAPVLLPLGLALLAASLAWTAYVALRPTS